MLELWLFAKWMGAETRDATREDDNDSTLMILILCMPLICAIAWPYFMWVWVRDTGVSRLTACLPVGTVVAGIALAVVAGWYWQAAVASMVVGIVSFCGILWNGWQIDRRRDAEETQEEVPEKVTRWRFS